MCGWNEMEWLRSEMRKCVMECVIGKRDGEVCGWNEREWFGIGKGNHFLMMDRKERKYFMIKIRERKNSFKKMYS